MLWRHCLLGLIIFLTNWREIKLIFQVGLLQNRKEVIHMNTIKSSFIVLFENPFWIGICERQNGSKMEVCKVVFGSEPKNYEVYNFLLNNLYKLKFSTPVKNTQSLDKKINPKRMQRSISRQLEETGIGTKAQQALKLQQEQLKTERKKHVKKRNEEQKQLKFELRQKKKKEKHRGR